MLMRTPNWVVAIAAPAFWLMSAANGTAAEPPRRLLHVSSPKPQPVPATEPAALEASIRRGIDFLLKDQNRDGSWGSPEKTKDLNIYAPVPGALESYHAAVTAMCVLALLETADPAADVQQAIDRGENRLFENLAKVRRPSADVLYNIWAHGYGIQALVKMYDRRPDDAARRQKIRELIANQIEMLGRYEAVDGGWGYYDFKYQTQKTAAMTTSFMSATMLVALHGAQDLGIEAPPKLVERAMASIYRQQKSDLSYLYGEYLHARPLHPVNTPQGSLGRTQACNAALRMWGDERITTEMVQTCLDRLFARNMWLDLGRKRPIPHESYFSVAGYFYYYGHYYAALCIEQLPAEQRKPQQDQMAFRLVHLQEKDGSWWDFPLYNYHQQYGTAFALMSLVRCRVTPVGG